MAPRSPSFAGVVLAALLCASPLRADDVTLPVPLQIELLVKVAGYDGGMVKRAQGKVRVFIVTKPGNEESARVATQAERALAAQATIAGLPHEEATVAFADAKGLAQLCRTKRAGIVYLTPGFSDADLGAVAGALDGVDVFTAAAVASFVPKGVVLGFDLVSGKPKLLVHLGQARKQSVQLGADLLKLAKVYGE